MRILIVTVIVILLSGCNGHKRDYSSSYYRNYDGWFYNDMATMQRNIKGKRYGQWSK